MQKNDGRNCPRYMSLQCNNQEYKRFDYPKCKLSVEQYWVQLSWKSKYILFKMLSRKWNSEWIKYNRNDPSLHVFTSATINCRAVLQIEERKKGPQKKTAGIGATQHESNTK